MPIGAWYVGAALRENGHGAEVINCSAINKTPNKTRALFEEKKPDVIGFTIMNANRWGAVEMARIARQVDPNVKIVFGGIGATLLWEHLLIHFREIDVVVLGEGEQTFLDILGHFENGNPDDLGKIPGIAFRDGPNAVRTQDRAHIEVLDALPNPARHFTYQHVALTRGCPENCAFCGSPEFWGRKVRFHSAEYFVDQLALLNQRGVSFFYFSDDNFTIRGALAIEVCREIVRRKLDISWAAISRVNLVNEEIISWMRRAGCVQISYGVESGSDRIRNAMNKNITKEQIKNAFALTGKYGILARAYIIYGARGETEETIRETIELMDEIRPLSAIFYILDIFPGTKLYADLKKRTGLTDDVWSQRIEDIMYFQVDPELSGETVLEFGKMLRSHYHANLPRYAESIKLVDDPEFYAGHSDFCSKLGMTFSHGDYANIDAIPDKERIAELLYEKALSYHPDHRAHLGLGILRQKAGKYRESAEILAQGAEYFPGSEPLYMCLGISHMNLGEYEQAIRCFAKFGNSREAARHIEICRKALAR